ncbi:hypothetical protein LCGC14_1918900 [marine sediment metagenome]|uniref:Uncharacterized protein n=1 Tax=marine sediment metagenome TaxID=412755 RepID=A0A0F9GEP5_9ZZZZ
MKRRSHQSKKLRDRRAGQSPYQRYGKRPYKYSSSKKSSDSTPREATPA